MSDEFGSCCATLKEVLTSKEFAPLIEVGDDGVLYMSVGIAEGEKDDDEGMVDYPVFFCPFCGTQLQEQDDEKTA
ncbi:MAG: hypothetical protein ACK4TL_00820 [Hyphomicrobiaceae bacterium]